MKYTKGEIYDYIVTTCPYCKVDIEEQWGRITDLTIPDPDSENEMECPKCKKEFICRIEPSI